MIAGAVATTAAISTVVLPASAYAQNANAQAQTIANHFSSIKTMTGDFVQFSPKGDMSEGTFYLERPGKIRFSYKDSPVRVITDGKSVAINNRKLDTWDLYQLSQTPMKMLLDNQIDLSGGRLLGVSQDPGATTIILADKSLGKGQIRMIFDSKTYELRQWTIVDQQNLETTVQITNVRTGVKFAKGMFDIPYQRIAMKRNRN
ncbi:outer-membrane lipoprotein carrier protein LolA [Bartonella sp. LJL80]